MSGPRAPHLEIRSAAPEGARFLAGLAQREGVELGVLDRGRHAVAYAKGAEAIGAVLAAAGASSVVLSLEEQAVLGATRARANRLANADHANLVRTSRAAHDQLRAVEQLQRSGVLAKLDTSLQEIAELRARHPTLSLRELASKCRPPATAKTPANHARLTFSSRGRLDAAAVIHSLGGGSVFVRRRIQTPSDATVQNTVQPEREVVLGASSPARRASRERSAAGLRALAGAPAKPARLR